MRSSSYIRRGCELEQARMAGDASKSQINMKAWILNKPVPVGEHPLYLNERAVPTPADDELVAACGICRS